MKLPLKIKHVFYFLLLLSCGTAEQKPVVIPADVLPKEKMAEVITDIHIAEAKAGLEPYQDSAYAITSFEKIFEQNKITRAQYDSSLVFYIEHPELLDTIYGQVLNELSKMQANTGKQ